MQIVTLTEAQTQLDRLVDLVESGEEITITRDGRAVARLVTTVSEPQLPSLADFRATQPEQLESASELIRRLRETDCY